MKTRNLISIDMLANFLCQPSYDKWNGYNPFIIAIETIIRAGLNKNKILICGNGGSAADSMHIAGELIKSFCIERKIHNEEFKEYLHKNNINITPGIAAISLSSDPVVMSACGNDLGYENIFAQQVNALGNVQDILIAITTSGTSKNIINACKVAFAKGLYVFVFTGENINKDLYGYTHGVISTNALITQNIQEQHEKMFHCMCRIIEDEIYGEEE